MYANGSRLTASRMTKSAFSDAHRLVVEAVAGARLNAGLHQAQVAEKLGKNQSYISNIERGQRRIDIVEFYALANAIGIDPKKLFEAATRNFPSDVAV